MKSRQLQGCQHPVNNFNSNVCRALFLLVLLNQSSYSYAASRQNSCSLD
jgi:hypothetical protein